MPLLNDDDVVIGKRRPLVREGAADPAQDSPEAAARLLTSHFRQNDMRFEWRDPRMLRPHNKNPKRHTTIQRRAFEDFAAEIGWAGALLYNERTNTLLDGHLRLQSALETNAERVPVLIVDVAAEEETKILALLDPIGQLFQINKAAFAELAAAIQTNSETLAQLLDGTVQNEEEQEEGDDDEESDDLLDIPPLPDGGVSLTLGEQFDYITLVFTTNFNWIAALDIFEINRQRCVFHPSQVGIGRVVHGDTFLNGLQEERRKMATIQAENDRLKKEMLRLQAELETYRPAPVAAKSGNGQLTAESVVE